MRGLPFALSCFLFFIPFTDPGASVGIILRSVIDHV